MNEHFCRILEKEKLPVKPLLMHLRKQGGGGKKGGKKGKGKATSTEQEQEPSSAPAAENEDEDDTAAGASKVAHIDASDATVPNFVAEEATPELIERKIRHVYQNKNPKKIGDVAKLMIKYKGKEAALYRAMVKKYEFDESFFDDMPPDEESSAEEEEDEEEEQEEDDDEDEAKQQPALALNPDLIGQRVLKIYQAKNPEKVDDVSKLMVKYKGKEPALYKAILNKYEIPASFFATEDAQLVIEAELKADPAEQARLKKIEEQKLREEEEMAAYLQKAKQAEADAACDCHGRNPFSMPSQCAARHPMPPCSTSNRFPVCFTAVRIDDEILSLKTKMMAVKVRGRENTLAGESDAAEREEFRSLKKQIETLEVGSAARVAVVASKLRSEF